MNIQQFKNINSLQQFNKIYTLIEKSKEDTNINYTINKYISLFNIKNINFNFKNKIQYKFNIQNQMTFKELYNQLITINKTIANKFKEKLIKLNSFQKKVIIFNTNYLIKKNSFNTIFSQFLKIKNNAVFQNFHFYSNFFDKFFNFIIYKAQIQNNQKFGFNSLMSIKPRQKIQQNDLQQTFIYVHKDLGQNELNRQLSYIINRILENNNNIYNLSNLYKHINT